LFYFFLKLLRPEISEKREILADALSTIPEIPHPILFI